MSDINPTAGGSYIRDAKTGELTRIADGATTTEAPATEAPATEAPMDDTTKKKDA